MKFKRLVTALLSATLMISLAACSGNEKPAESQTGEGTTAEAIHVNLAESWGFEYFYTIITPDVSSSTGYDITYYLTSFYDTLVTYNENNELVGSLAEDWSMSDDGKVYTFHIKEGIKFSDGSDLTAEDVAKSLMAVPVNLGQYNGGYGRLSTIIESAEATDDYTVELRLTQPYYNTLRELCLEDVTFSYETAEQPAISNLSFIAKTGTTTALVGHSGSGKSTTASLIPRFYDAGEGKIKIGGVDIQEIAHKDLMQMVAFVFQNPKLFKDSLLENIRAGRPNATREEVLQAAHMAQCDDILAKFPQGIDTVVGSKGVYLSGGETQRIAIARAILKNAPIIVLDEATAYADPENEQQIQQAFEGLTKGKTVIMIAHRLSTIQDADQILVMKQGKLAEQGTHTSLVEQNGEYARMWENYTKTTQWHIGNEVKVC